MTSVGSCRMWTDNQIACLTSRDIAQLNYDQMLELVTSAEADPARSETTHVTESDVLVRLVYAHRQRCRNKMASQKERSRKAAEWHEAACNR
ncbi:MAG: hypothetical protein H8E66_26200 [Planctomycetes bacterium]|nr:hypothetical protein [Planctomycetota bacterium]